MSFEQELQPESPQLPVWKAIIVNWIDKNYGTDEQLARLGLQKRAWYQFNLLEIGLSALVLSVVLRALGYL